MGGGTIIINRASVLLPAINNSSIYDYLSDADKDHVEVLNQKGFAACTDGDVRWIIQKIAEVAC